MHWRSWWVHSENLIKRSRWGVSSSYGLHVMQVKLLCYFYICLLYYIHAHRCNGPARYTVWNLMMSVPLFLSRATAAVVCVTWKAVLRLLGWCVSWLLSSTQNLNLDFGQNFTWFACDRRNVYFRASYCCNDDASKCAPMMPHLLNGGARNGSWYLFVHDFFLNKSRKETYTLH